MSNRKSFPCLAASFLCFALPVVLRAQQAAPPHDGHTTVNVAMGDVGGKFFGRVPDKTKTRRYYIAAEPQLWNYAPQGCQVMCHDPAPPPAMAKSKSGKIRYVQYTDETFQSKVIENPRLGILGPTLRGVVGEYLAITFLNRTSRPLSMHPHGVKYDKDSEGSHYNPQPGLGAAVGPGARFTYVWHLDEDSGPRPDEPSSKGWLYHSHVTGDEETNLGLVGFVIVTDPRRARPDGSPVGIDREMAALFMIFDESGLGQAEKEAAEYGLPGKTWTQVQELMEQGGRYSINGYIFGNLPGLEMNEGERVRWYLFGLGSEVDFHTAHWHGLRVVEEGRRRTDVVELLPATMKVADMVADNPGTWLFHCHVSEHMIEGMFARMVVHPKSSAVRAPDPAFFGLRQEEQSLQIKRAEVVLGSTPGAETFELKLEGAVTVYEGFSLFVEPVRIQVGEKTATFKPDFRGVANTLEGSFIAKNSNQNGVVYGGLLEFEATLRGADWMNELKKLGLTSGIARRQPISARLTLHLGRAQHITMARIATKTN